MNDDYLDILHLPHPDPAHHKRMPISARAAQFAPFAALTGYDDSIAEAGRIAAAHFEATDTMQSD